MADVITFSPEQFDKLVSVLKGKPAGTGLGKDFRVAGLGCGDGGMGPMAMGVYEMLALGSPRLALAKALGVRMVPYDFSIRATFPTVDTVDVPEVGADVKIVQDTLIEDFRYRITNKSTQANINQFQPQFDYYFNFQSGIEMTLDIKGAPRPSLFPEFTPISNVADMFNGNAKTARGFILTYQQQLQASFHASVTLPFAPIEVVFTCNAWTPDNDMFVEMTNKEAFSQLGDCGFIIDEAYCDRVCSICR